MIGNVLTKVFGSKHQREIKKLWPLIGEIDGHFQDLGKLTDEQLQAKTAEFRETIAREKAEGRAERGVCVCGSGIGIGIAANKVAGIRAAVVHDSTTATLARRHNDANVLCLGERTTGPAQAVDAVDAFFSTDFDGGRHQRRIDQIAGFDAGTGAVVAPRETDDQERQ